jgi:OHCU decarboxylase
MSIDPVVLTSVCGSKEWVKQMVRLTADPGVDNATVLKNSSQVWFGLQEQDWLEAFAAHPKIGDIETLKKKYGGGKEALEQGSVFQAELAVLERLSKQNDEYLKKFGFIFIVCAKGKSASEMLELLNKRIQGSRPEELKNAAIEQDKIMRLRLEAHLEGKT